MTPDTDRPATAPALERLPLEQALDGLITADTLSAVAEAAAAAARILTGADGISFVLRDGDHCHYYRENTIAPLWAGRRFPAESCISGWCMAKGVVTVVDDVATDPRIPQEVYAGTYVRSLVAIPVRHGDPVACIVAYRADGGFSTEDDVAALKMVAEVAGLAFARLDLKHREAHQRMLVSELRHRAKNMLALVQGYASQTLRRARTLADFRSAFTGRIHALGTAHEVLFRERDGVVPLEEAARAALAPFSPDGRRLTLSGPFVAVPAARHVTLSMAFHELGTNAQKYGALTAPDGHVDVTWTVAQADDGGRRIAITWTETGGPAPRTPEADGFGLTFIGRALRHELRGETEVRFAPEGLRATIAFTLPPVDAADAQQPAARVDVLPG